MNIAQEARKYLIKQAQQPVGNVPSAPQEPLQPDKMNQNQKSIQAAIKSTPQSAQGQQANYKNTSFGNMSAQDQRYFDESKQQETDRINKLYQSSSQRFAAQAPRPRRQGQSVQAYNWYLNNRAILEQRMSRLSAGGFFGERRLTTLFDPRPKLRSLPKMRARLPGESQFAYQQAKKQHNQMLLRYYRGRSLKQKAIDLRNELGSGAWSNTVDSAVQGFSAIDTALADKVTRGLASPQQLARYKEQAHKQKLRLAAIAKARLDYDKSQASSKAAASVGFYGGTAAGFAAGAFADAGLTAIPLVKGMKTLGTVGRVGYKAYKAKQAGQLGAYAWKATRTGGHALKHYGKSLKTLKGAGKAVSGYGGQATVNSVTQGGINAAYQVMHDPNASLEQKQKAYDQMRMYQMLGRVGAYGLGFAGGRMGGLSWGQAGMRTGGNMVWMGFPIDMPETYIPTAREAINNPRTLMEAVTNAKDPRAVIQAMYRRQWAQGKGVIGKAGYGFLGGADIAQPLVWGMAPNAAQIWMRTGGIGGGAQRVKDAFYNSDPQNLAGRAAAAYGKMALMDDTRRSKAATKIAQTLDKLPQEQRREYLPLVVKRVYNQPMSYEEQNKLDQLIKMDPEGAGKQLKAYAEYGYDTDKFDSFGGYDESREGIFNNFKRTFANTWVGDGQKGAKYIGGKAYDKLGEIEAIAKQKDPVKRQEMIRQAARSAGQDSFGTSILKDKLLNTDEAGMRQIKDQLVQAVNAKKYTGQDLLRIANTYREIADESGDKSSYIMSRLMSQVAADIIQTNNQGLVQAVNNISTQQQYLNTARTATSGGGNAGRLVDTTYLQIAAAEKGKQIFNKSSDQFNFAKQLALFSDGTNGDNLAAKALKGYMTPILVRQAFRDPSKFKDLASIWFHSKGMHTAGNVVDNPAVFWGGLGTLGLGGLWLLSMLRGIGGNKGTPKTDQTQQNPYYVEGLQRYQ